MSQNESDLLIVPVEFDLKKIMPKIFNNIYLKFTVNSGGRIQGNLVYI